MLVAVYGSLRKGMGNHTVIDPENSKFLGTFVVPLLYEMVDLGYYPGVIRTTEENDITLEVWDVSEQVFSNLDYLEGYPNHYNRKQVLVHNHTVWLYYLVSTSYTNSTPVPSGDWVEHYNH